MNPPLSGDWITHGMKFLEIKAVGSMEEKKKKGVWGGISGVHRRKHAALCSGLCVLTSPPAAS